MGMLNIICAKPKAIVLPCPFCGEENASIQVRLWCLDSDEEQFQCGDCDAEFGAKQIRDVIRKWSKVLAWIDQAPDVEATE